MVNPDFYDEAYFECGIFSGQSLYADYRWLPELTIPFCAEILELLGISRADTILDFVCAKGYMVKAFRLLGREAFGVDISEYAVSRVPEEIKPYITLIRSPEDIPSIYTWIVVKDVFEHIEYDDLDYLLEKLRSIGQYLFAIIPLGDGEKFLEEREEKDVTHRIKESMAWWENRFIEVGYDISYVLARNGKGWFSCA